MAIAGNACRECVRHGLDLPTGHRSAPCVPARSSHGGTLIIHSFGVSARDFRVDWPAGPLTTTTSPEFLDPLIPWTTFTDPSAHVFLSYHAGKFEWPLTAMAVAILVEQTIRDRCILHGSNAMLLSQIALIGATSAVTAPNNFRTRTQTRPQGSSSLNGATARSWPVSHSSCSWRRHSASNLASTKGPSAKAMAVCSRAATLRPSFPYPRVRASAVAQRRLRGSVAVRSRRRPQPRGG